MTPFSLAARLRRVSSQSAVLFGYGNPLSSVRFFTHSMLRRKTPVHVTIESTPMLIRSSTHDLKVALSCLRDAEFDAAIRASRARHRFIVDAGGYIGTAAIAFARAFPDSTVVSLEPSPVNFELLAENVRPWKNIVPIRKALSDHDGTMDLFNRGTGEWGFTTISAAGDATMPALVDQIECVSIPTLLRDFSKTGIDILKLDIEGGERPLLECRPAWLADVDVVIAELHERIASGCARAFYRATESMKDVYCGGEKVMAVRTGPPEAGMDQPGASAHG